MPGSAAGNILVVDDHVDRVFISGHGGELQARLGGDLAASAARLEKPVNVEQLLVWVAEALHGTTERPRR